MSATRNTTLPSTTATSIKLEHTTTQELPLAQCNLYLLQDALNLNQALQDQDDNSTASITAVHEGEAGISNHLEAPPTSPLLHIPTASELLHLVDNHAAWVALKHANPLLFGQLVKLRELDARMEQITIVIKGIRAFSVCAGGIKNELISLVDMRLFLFEDYKTTLDNIHYTFHSNSADTIDDLRYLAHRRHYTPRRHFEWVTFPIPYSDGPEPTFDLVQCPHCKRDGHVYMECGFFEAEPGVAHVNRYQTDNHRPTPVHPQDHQPRRRRRNNNKRRARDLRNEGW